MKRLALLFALLIAAPAQADPVALGRSDALALADGAAIVARASSAAVTVMRVPFDGGTPQVLLRSPLAANRRALVEIAASEQRVGVIVTLMGREAGYLKSAQVFTGPPAGPLVPAGEPFDLRRGQTGGPAGVSAAGDAIIVEDDEGIFTSIAPDGARTAFRLRGDFSGADFAGDLVAYGQRTDRESEEDPPTRLLVENWRTGTELHRLELPAGLIRLDLRDDGRAILELDGGALRELSPDGTLTSLAADASTPVQAGDRIVVRRHDNASESDRLVVLEGSGTVRHGVGLNARIIEDVSADAGHVIWRSNGCAFSAAIDDGPATAFTNAGCRASEPYVRTLAESPRLSRTVRIPIGCLNAEDGVCRGSVRGREIAPAPYAVPAGEHRNVAVHVKARSYRKLKRERFRVIHLTSPPGFPFLLQDGPDRLG